MSSREHRGSPIFEEGGPLDIDGPFPQHNQKEAAELFKELWNKRAEEKQLFREKNDNPDYEGFEQLVKGRKLDSNFKKCTAFVRKMKQFVESQKNSIESDLNSLNLTKYQSEIAAVIVEGKFKMSEINSILGIASELHRRYGDFSGHLLENFKKILPTKKTEVVPATISKASSDLRLFSELLLAGVLPQEEGISQLILSIKSMMFLDREGPQFLTPLANLLRGLTDDLLGIIRNDTCADLKNNGVMLKDLRRSDAICSERKSELKKILQDYFEMVASGIVEKHEAMLKSEKYNRKLLVTKGEVPSDRQEAHAELSTRFEKFHSSACKLAFLLDMEMPTLRQLPADPEEDLEKALLTTDDGEILTEVPGIVLFDNEETRQFYQDYPDLKVYLPPVVYRENILQMQEKTKKMEELEKLVDEFDEETEQAELQDDKETNDEDTNEADGDVPPSMRLENEEKENTDTKETIELPKKQAFNNFLDGLQNCVNKNLIDKAAIEFAESHNTKRHRKDLVKRLFLVPRQRMDLIQLYSRLVAILSRVFPDVGMDLCTLLQKDFRYLVFKKDQIKIETKLKITRFIGELVNFSIFPKSESFNCLKMLLRNFLHHQVEMACVFVETCGRFLYRSYDTHRRMKIYLEEMLRKKIVRNMEPRYVYMLDSAYFHICPPPAGALQKKKKPAFQAFAEYIFLDDLNSKTVYRAVSVLNAMDMKDGEKFSRIAKILSCAWKFNYAQMETAAALLAAIKKTHTKLVLAVIENLTEYIRIGCDHPVDELNKLRLSTCQYLAYIYSYRIISTITLFNVWYFLISYGVTYKSDEFTPMDPPDNLYRVRMVGQMLKICGEYFSGSSSKRRLNCFLKYFQRYYVYKRNLPCWIDADFPHSVEEFYENTFKRLRSKWKLARTIEEADRDITEMDENLREKVKSDEIKTVMKNPKQANFMRLSTKLAKKIFVSRDSSELSDSSLSMSTPRRREGRSEYDSDVSSLTLGSPRFDPYEAEVHDEESAKDLEDKEFLAAFDRMCIESHQSQVKAPKPEISIPVISAAKTADLETSKPLVNVTLVTKRNNKQKLKTLAIPAEEDFLVNLKSREEAEKLEKQRMKSRTLAITRMQEEEEFREAEQSLQHSSFFRLTRSKR